MKVSTLIFILVLVVDGWFIFMQKAIFYSDEHAYGFARQGLSRLLRDFDLDERFVSQEVRYVDRSALERIMNIPSLYSGSHWIYPVHEFMWLYEEDGEVLPLWAAVTAPGMVTYTMNIDMDVWERLDVYEQ